MQLDGREQRYVRDGSLVYCKPVRDVPRSQEGVSICVAVELRSPAHNFCGDLWLITWHKTADDIVAAVVSAARNRAMVVDRAPASNQVDAGAVWILAQTSDAIEQLEIQTVARFAREEFYTHMAARAAISAGHIGRQVRERYVTAAYVVAQRLDLLIAHPQVARHVPHPHRGVSALPVIELIERDL